MGGAHMKLNWPTWWFSKEVFIRMQRNSKSFYLRFNQLRRRFNRFCGKLLYYIFPASRWLYINNKLVEIVVCLPINTLIWKSALFYTNPNMNHPGIFSFSLIYEEQILLNKSSSPLDANKNPNYIKSLFQTVSPIGKFWPLK
jgi:hypothetical protein